MQRIPSVATGAATIAGHPNEYGARSILTTSWNELQTECSTLMDSTGFRSANVENKSKPPPRPARRDEG